MRYRETRHYTEEEILLHLFGEEDPAAGKEVSRHLEGCGQCSAVWLEFRGLRERVTSWTVPEVPESVRKERKAELIDQFRRDQLLMPREGLLGALLHRVQGLWNYAVENPLPTMGYVAVGIAFASERTITMFHLDRILPATDQVFEILRRIF